MTDAAVLVGNKLIDIYTDEVSEFLSVSGNIKALDSATRSLLVAQADVKKRVENAELNGFRRTTAVDEWLEKVEAVKNQVDQIVNQKKPRFFHFLSNYQINKDLIEKHKVVKELLSISDSMKIDIVTIPLPSIQDQDLHVGSDKAQKAMIANFLKEIAREKPIQFSSEQLVNFTQNYSIKLGSGGFGTVYKGKLPNGMPIAVKVLNNNLDKRVEQQFMAEVGSIGRTYHINLVRLFGFCFDSNARALVYEYMENGGLDNLLFKDGMAEGGLSFSILHEISVGTAKGIRYLHEECQQKIIHYDIKPGNILLDDKFTPKVADFGLAKLMSRENTHVSMTGIRGTPGYAAPEVWMGIGVTEACDVYSFGMLLFEIVGRRKNFVEASNGNSSDSHQWFPRIVWERYSSGLLAELVAVIHGMMDEEDRSKAERMCKVALWCVQHQPKARPPMSKVVKMLEGEMDVSPPVNPFQHLEPIADLGMWDQSSSSGEI